MESRIELRIVLLLGFEDANSLISGILNLKGCKVYKSAKAEDCLNLLNQIEGQVDAILVKKEIAINDNFMLLNNIKKIAPATMNLVLTDKVDCIPEKLSEKYGIKEGDIVILEDSKNGITIVPAQVVPRT